MKLQFIHETWIKIRCVSTDTYICLCIIVRGVIRLPTPIAARLSFLYILNITTLLFCFFFFFVLFCFVFCSVFLLIFIYIFVVIARRLSLSLIRASYASHRYRKNTSLSSIKILIIMYKNTCTNSLIYLFICRILPAVFSSLMLIFIFVRFSFLALYSGFAADARVQCIGSISSRFVVYSHFSLMW